MKRNFFLIALLLFFLISLVSASWTPPGDINLRSHYNINNGVNATFQWFKGVFNWTTGDIYNSFDGSTLSFNESKLNSSIDSRSGSLNVNSSDYWDNMNTINTTQMENNGGVLNILESWLKSLFYTKAEVNTNISDANTSMKNYVDGTFITQANEGNLNVNSSEYWNGTKSFNSSELERQTNGNLGILDSFINLLIDNRVTQSFVKNLGFYNTTETDTEIENANNSMKNYVDTNYYNTTEIDTQNTTMTNFVINTNSSMKTYVDSQDTTFNDSMESYVNSVNNTQATWVDTLFVRFTELVGQVGNWTADKGDYYTSAETDTEIENANTSMKSYVDTQDLTYNNSVVNWADGKFVVNSGGEMVIFMLKGDFFII